MFLGCWFFKECSKEKNCSLAGKAGVVGGGGGAAVSHPQWASELPWIKHYKGKEASFLEIPAAFVFNTKYCLRVYIETYLSFSH